MIKSCCFLEGEDKLCLVFNSCLILEGSLPSGQNFVDAEEK